MQWATFFSAQGIMIAVALLAQFPFMPLQHLLLIILVHSFINNGDFMSYQHLSDSWYSDLLFESLERVKNMAVYIFPVLIYNHNNSNSMQQLITLASYQVKSLITFNTYAR